MSHLPTANKARMKDAPPTPRKAWRAVGILVGLAAGLAFFLHAQQALSGQDLAMLASGRALAGMGVCVAGYVLAIGVAASAWQRLLRGLGAWAAWHKLAWILAATQLAKYLPGNVGAPVGRWALGLQQGLANRPLLLSLAMESGMAVVLAATMGGLALLASPVGRQAWEVLAATMGETGPWVIGGVLALVAVAGGWALMRQKAGQPIGMPKGGPLAQAAGAYALHYLVLGAGAAGLALLAFPALAGDLALLYGAVLMGWVAGFLAPGLPAGLGVREGLMAFILQAGHPDGSVVLFILAFRLATMAGDVVLAAWAFFGARGVAPRPSPGQS